MRIIGIDPGTAITGFGVIDIEKGGKASLVEAGVVRTPAHTPLPERLLTIHTDITELIEEFKPHTMSIEKLYFARNVTTAISVAHARGVVILAGEHAGLTVYEYTPLQIKQAMTGYGRATKSQIQEMVRVMLGLKKAPSPDDAADALAAALTHSHQL
jgi:crossover junction endodeoxyribonuclease RuvC